MTGALSLLSTTLPMIVATAATVRVTEVAFKRKGRAVGTKHWHFKREGVAVSHQHEGGHLSHYHKGLRGYGRTRRTLRR